MNNATYCKGCGQQLETSYYNNMSGYAYAASPQAAAAVPQKQGMSTGATVGICASVGIAIIAIVLVVLFAVFGVPGQAVAADTNTNTDDAAKNVSVNVSVDANGNAAKSTSTSSSTSYSSTSYASSSSSSSTYNLTVELAAGGTLSGTVHRNSAGYVLSDSDTHQYTESELSAKGLNDAERCIAWNEPYARAGRHFNNPQLRAYFNSCSWYHDSGSTDVTVGGTASKNCSLLQSMLTNSSWRSLKSS